MDDVRLAEPDDLPLLAPIEAAADSLVVAVLDCDPSMFTTTPGAQRASDPGFLLVCGRPATGFAQVLEQDGTAHLQQLCVDPAYARSGRGTALLAACCAEAARRGHDALSLTTFRDVAFNRPFYERQGFVVVEQPAEEWGDVLARHLHDEAAYDALSPRVGMVRALVR